MTHSDEDTRPYGYPCEIAPTVGGNVDDRNFERCWHEGGLWHDITADQHEADRLRIAADRLNTINSARDQRDEDLKTVVETAFEWCGEYGFSQPEEANRVWAAAKRLRPDLEPER